jgi:SynChlorMet cassette radical SAM/SPASM protein ScmF
MSDLSLNVETNGVLCTSKVAQMISRCKNAFVSVSLDGADAERHEWVRGVSGCFEAALGGIRNLVNAGLKPQVIMTLMRQNKDQMEPLVRLAERLDAGSVKFNIMQPTARGKKMHESGEVLTLEELVDLGQWVENTLSRSTRLRVHFSHPLAFRPLSKLFGQDGDGCAVCGILGILGVLGNGSYALCGIGETEPDLVFGHAATRRLAEVWEKTPVLLELREGLPERLERICGDCLMKTRCLGSCIAQNYYRSKDIWAPFWYCEEARNQGLFPESRLCPIT